MVGDIANTRCVDAVLASEEHQYLAMTVVRQWHRNRTRTVHHMAGADGSRKPMRYLCRSCISLPILSLDRLGDRDVCATAVFAFFRPIKMGPV
jgi:hypothetical protein